MNVKKLIINTTIDILQSENIGSFPVDTILKSAEISRSTFYRYFTDKYDVVNAYYETFFNSLDEDSTIPWEEHALTIMTYIFDNKSLIKNTFDSEKERVTESCFYHHAEKFLKKQYLKPLKIRKLTVEEQVAIELYTTGALQVSFSWVEKNTNMSASQMTKIVYNMMPEILRKRIVDEKIKELTNSVDLNMN